MHIRFRLKHWRDNFMVSQEEVAFATGLTQAALSRLETTDPRRVDLGTLEKLCEAFRLHPGDFFLAVFDDMTPAVSPWAGTEGQEVSEDETDMRIKKWLEGQKTFDWLQSPRYLGHRKALWHFDAALKLETDPRLKATIESAVQPSRQALAEFERQVRKARKKRGKRKAKKK